MFMILCLCSKSIHTSYHYIYNYITT